MVGIHGWTRVELARPDSSRSGLRSPLPRPRASATDRRGSSRRSAALSCPPAAGPPCGLRVGARADMRYAADHREPTPPPIRAQATPSLTRTVQIRPKRRISNGACPSAPSEALFRAFSGALGPKMAPAPSFRPQNGLRRRCKAACNSPRVSRKAENSGPLAFRRPPARRGLKTAPGTVPTAQARSVLGSCLSALRGSVSQSSEIFFNSPWIKPAPHATPPSHLRARRSPTSGPEKRSRHYAAPEAAAAKGAARLRRAPFFLAPSVGALYGAQRAPRAPLNSPRKQP